MKWLNNLFEVLCRLMKLVRLSKFRMVPAGKKVKSNDPLISLIFSSLMFFIGLFTMKSGGIISLILGIGSILFSVFMLKLSVELWEILQHVKQ